MASRCRSARRLRLLRRRGAARKLAGGAGVEARRRRSEGEGPEGDETPGEHRAGRRLHRWRLRNGLAPGSNALKPGRWLPGPSTAPHGTAQSRGRLVGPPRAAANRHEGRGNVERRSGSGRGKSSVGEGTPRALRHETRPGRSAEEQTVGRVRNPEDGTDRVRQTRARSGNASQWTRTAGQCCRSRNLRRGAAHACQMRGRRRRSYSVAGATPWMGCTGT